MLSRKLAIRVARQRPVPPNRSAFELLIEQRERLLPCVARVLFAVNVFARIVEESVRASLVDLHLARLAEPLERGREPVDIRALNPSVVLAVGVEDWASEARQSFVGRNFAIERGRSL